MTKYNSSDNIKRLASDDDVASRELGGSWRMPTAEEFDKIVSACYWQWFEDYRYSSLRAEATSDSEDIPIYSNGTPNYAVDMCFSVFYTDTFDYYERCFAMPIRAVAGDR